VCVFLHFVNLLLFFSYLMFSFYFRAVRVRVVVR